MCNLRPTSRGHVRITSADPRAHPAIRLNYLATPEDQRVAADAMRFTRRIMAARALARYAPEEWKPVVHEVAVAIVDGKMSLKSFAEALGRAFWIAYMLRSRRVDNTFVQS